MKKMIKQNELAIVIPAYKIDFFESVLKSLANQTDKRFSLYVGIDASPGDFESILDAYSSNLDIHYKRFKENLGGKNLVAQWNRCLDLVMNETWIWLFSDDDIMEPRCVECFYQELEKMANYDLYHFNVNIIDEKNDLVIQTKEYPKVIDSVSFLKAKNNASLDSFVVEYIFRKSTFKDLGGFQYFDMAWGTDIATWAKLGKAKGIKTISGAKVLWRQSSLNITPSKDIPKLKRKLAANVSFFTWCRNNFNEISQTDAYYYMFRMLFHYTPYLQSKDFKNIINPFYCKTKFGKVLFWFIVSLYPCLKFFHKIIHF